MPDDTTLFTQFFQHDALKCLLDSITLALEEDNTDLTSQALFTQNQTATAHIIAKEETRVAGLPLIAIILDCYTRQHPTSPTPQIQLHATEGHCADKGALLAEITGPATSILGTERVILNYMAHLSGIAQLTSRYVQALRGTKTSLLDTRKTLPGLRYPAKYAVLAGGGMNHRLHLADMLMLKDNHIDQAGSITLAVTALRETYSPCPPIEVECRTTNEVMEAAGLQVDRIMLDNMPASMLASALAHIPDNIETEVSGNVTLETIHTLAQAGPDFISVGKLTHSAPAADLSMRIHLTQRPPINER